MPRTPVFFQATFNLKTGLFDFVIQGEGQGRMTMELPPSEFLQLATYLAKVGASYQEWLKKGGKVE